MLLQDLVLLHLLELGVVPADFSLLFGAQTRSLLAIVGLPIQLLLDCFSALMT